jgi:hypothetical protein
MGYGGAHVSNASQPPPDPWGGSMSCPGTAPAPLFYREVQHFRQPHLWVLLLGLAGFSFFTAVSITIQGISPGKPGISDPLFVVAGIAFGLGFPVFFAFLALEVEVRTDGIRYRFFPLHSAYHTITWDDLERYQVTSCRSAREYGGFGIRYKWKGYACSLSGDRGILFYLHDGTRVMIGSVNPGDFALAVAKGSGILPTQ